MAESRHNELSGWTGLRRAGRAAAWLQLFGLSAFSLLAAPAAEVLAVEPTRVADLILLGRGFDAGFRQGMVCRITRGPLEVAEVILVELRPTCSAALIVSLAARQSIRTGDAASVKILKS